MDAILLSAGKSRRFKTHEVKQLIRLEGKPIFIHTIEKLFLHSKINRVILVVPPGDKNTYENILSEYNINNTTTIEGGNTRQESVYKSLELVETESVLIHEAVRPTISLDLIQRLLENQEEVAVVPVVDIPFTVSLGTDYMEETLKRERLRNVQLPQLFNTEVITRAHHFAKENKINATEDSMLVFNIGMPVKFIEGEITNIKITYPIDILLTKAILFGEWKL